jgi:hypothetical protein
VRTRARAPRPTPPRPPPRQAAEALRRAKFKFPGRQKIVTSRNWGFTPYKRDDFLAWKKEGRLVNTGVHATVRGGGGGRPAAGVGRLGGGRPRTARRGRAAAA